MDAITTAVFLFSVIFLPLAFRKFIKFEQVITKPANAFFIAGLFTFLGFITAIVLFPSMPSIVSIGLCSLFSVPFLVKFIEKERSAKRTDKKQAHSLKYFLHSHQNLVIFYAALFFGMALEYTLLFGFLPPDMSSAVFDNQLGLIGPGGLPPTQSELPGILSNNIQLMAICFALSIFFGAGSMLILSYNASLIGVVYGSGIRALAWSSGFQVFSNPMAYLPHTILEIVAYLLAAIGGGVLSKGLGSRQVVFESFMYLAFALTVVFFAGLVEVTIPAMFI